MEMASHLYLTNEGQSSLMPDFPTPCHPSLKFKRTSNRGEKATEIEIEWKSNRGEKVGKRVGQP